MGIRIPAARRGKAKLVLIRAPQHGEQPRAASRIYLSTVRGKLLQGTARGGSPSVKVELTYSWGCLLLWTFIEVLFRRDCQYQVS